MQTRNLNRLERRSRIRFPLKLRARFAVVGEAKIEGTGRTVNLSSQGALIRCAQNLSSGTRLRVMIEWPIFVGGNRVLLLDTQGIVVRAENDCTAVHFVEAALCANI